MVSKKQIFAAVALIAIAMTTIAYAQLLTGTITVTTEEVVSAKTWTKVFPARGAFKRTESGVITLDFTKGGFATGDKVLVKVELVIDDPKIHELKSLVVKIKNATHTLAVLTLGTPYAEFEVTVPAGSTSVSYDAEIVAVTGEKAVSTTFKLSASIIGWA
ncbi:MAG: hypothetical protein K6T73_06305 [Candidatus Bathyarchaeota archaeon]|nr:hypothetical protein [Candidatus Bathyarchaeota archaeon]